MAVLDKDARIPHFLPSLAHITVVKMVNYFFMDLFNDLKTLDKIYAGIQQGISARFNKSNENYQKAKKAQEKLLLIPAHLRHTVYKTITGMRYDSAIWFLYNISRELIPNWQQGRIFFRTDGTVDRNKMAQIFVLNKTMDISLRFHVACLHCLEESVVSLWKEMETCGKTKNFDTGNKLLTNFWIKWIQEGSRIPWLEALKKYLTSPPALSSEGGILIAPFFTLLQLEERKILFTYLERTYNIDDLRFCVYAATKEEAVKILKNKYLSFLIHHLHWPLQNIFLEVAEMGWHFLDTASFIEVLLLIWDVGMNKKYFDYCQLFLDFWNRCPITLRETIKEYPTKSQRINSILNRIRKRKRSSIADTNKNKWIRRDGRLESTICLTSTD